MIRVTRETHDTPDYVQEACIRAGGLNRYGEPNYRVVWGWNALQWSGGKWTDSDDSGNFIREVIELRQIPKHIPYDRWHLERWIPPEAEGSPRAWYERTTKEVEPGIFIPSLGPYPSRGQYVHSWTLQDPKGEFIPLSTTTIRYFIAAIELSRTFRSEDKRLAHKRVEEKKEQDWDSYADSVLDDGPAFHKQPFVTVPEMSA